MPPGSGKPALCKSHRISAELSHQAYLRIPTNRHLAGIIVSARDCHIRHASGLRHCPGRFCLFFIFRLPYGKGSCLKNRMFPLKSAGRNSGILDAILTVLLRVPLLFSVFSGKAAVLGCRREPCREAKSAKRGLSPFAPGSLAFFGFFRQSGSAWMLPGAMPGGKTGFIRPCFLQVAAEKRSRRETPGSVQRFGNIPQTALGCRCLRDCLGPQHRNAASRKTEPWEPRIPNGPRPECPRSRPQCSDLPRSRTK